ncbi:hypothetical protein [Clostridium sp.]|uniref:hypothetical protein n=1 Tax=Clostridium sp. TaxID=1506 RepID=UPI0026228C94|nr:hypothetical protein [Clostridium sp.]
MKKISIILLSLFSLFLFISCGSEGKDIVINIIDNEIEVEENEKRDIKIQSKDTYKQFRENKKKVNKNDLRTYYKNDLTLKKFQAPKKTIEEYESWFIDMVRDRGENTRVLSDAFRSVDILVGENIVKYPVIIDTVIFNDKESYIIAYLFEEVENLDMESQEAMNLREFKDVLVIGVYKESSDVFYENRYKF